MEQQHALCDVYSHVEASAQQVAEKLVTRPSHLFVLRYSMIPQLVNKK